MLTVLFFLIYGLCIYFYISYYWGVSKTNISQKSIISSHIIYISIFEIYFIKLYYKTYHQFKKSSYIFFEQQFFPTQTGFTFQIVFIFFYVFN